MHSVPNWLLIIRSSLSNCDLRKSCNFSWLLWLFCHCYHLSLHIVSIVTNMMRVNHNLPKFPLDTFMDFIFPNGTKSGPFTYIRFVLLLHMSFVLPTQLPAAILMAKNLFLMFIQKIYAVTSVVSQPARQLKLPHSNLVTGWGCHLILPCFILAHFWYTCLKPQRMFRTMMVQVTGSRLKRLGLCSRRTNNLRKCFSAASKTISYDCS